MINKHSPVPDSVPSSGACNLEPRLNVGLGFGRGAAAAGFDVGDVDIFSAAGFDEAAAARVLFGGFFGGLSALTFSTLIAGSFCFLLLVKVVLILVFVGTGLTRP